MSPARKEAQRTLANLRSFVRRGQLTGWVRDRSARPQYELAAIAVCVLEDVEGVDAAGPFADRLRGLRDEAMAAGLLTPGQVLKADASATAAADRRLAARA